MALDYFAIITNSLFAGILGVSITQALFFIIARVFNFDFIYPIETGRIMRELSEEFYSDFYAGTRGFLIHIGIGLLIMSFYSLVFIHVIGIFFDIGPYTYETPSGTAVIENIFWLGLLGLIIYFAWYLRDYNGPDKFSIFFFCYLLTLTLVMAVLFGLYLVGKPGLLSFKN